MVIHIFFFFNDTATTEIYTLSYTTLFRSRKEGRTLWWPIIARNKKSVTLNLREEEGQELARRLISEADVLVENFRPGTMRSEEHTSELQSRQYLVCRLLLEKKKNNQYSIS